jgi:2',3'-cyclic-nucleotide 2'-phosphodiesterase (5'-nucleotidase family)
VQYLADTAYINQLQPFKKLVDAKMNVVIGRAAETMRGHAPESLLSNFSADAYRASATAYSKSDVDIAIVNLGGLRTVIPAGDIQLRKVFELMPFENELVILWLKGDKLNELCQYFASKGGEGVSGLRFVIDNNKALDITINGRSLETDKLYSIATNDYLAGGNDKMVALANYEKRVNTGIKVRSMLLDYIKAETAKGNEIRSALDGRIVVYSK